MNADLILKFKQMIAAHKTFRLERAEPPIGSHLAGGFLKYSVEMYTYVHTEPSLNQQLFNLSVTSIDISVLHAPELPENSFEPVSR